jgi:hypothetical protein
MRQRYAADAAAASRILLDWFGRAPARALLGLVVAFATQAGIAVTAPCSRTRYALGVCPTSSVKRELNEPREVHPTAMQASVTLEPARSSAIARSIRRVIR